MSLILSDTELKYYKNKFNYFKNKFDLIQKIKLNDKIGICNDIIYIDEYKWNRYIKRRFNNQSSSKIKDYLKKEFNIFIKFLDQYLDIVKLLKTKNILTNNLYYFISNIISGLYNLKKSYNENNKILPIINSIILTLYEFNENVEEKLLVRCRKNSM